MVKRSKRLVRLDLTATVGHSSEASLPGKWVWVAIALAVLGAGYLIWLGISA